MNDVIEQIGEALERLRIVSQIGDGVLEVSRGRGPTARKATLEPAAFLDWLAGREGDVGRWIAGYASGVETVLLEPSRSKASEWEFERAAGTLFPSIEVESFRLGVTDATGGDAPYFDDFHGDLVVAYEMRLDLGRRALTRGQFDGWSAPGDRVEAAARSLLFHGTRNASWERLDGAEHIESLRAPDQTAARALVVADAFFDRVDSSFRFAIPEPETLIATFEDSQSARDELRAAAGRIHAGADYPLTTDIFEYRRGKPVPADGEPDE